MRSGSWGWVCVIAGWALMFGNPRTDGVGWKELEVFDSQGSCEEELQVRAREVSEKTATSQPVEVVRRFYRCVRRP